MPAFARQEIGESLLRSGVMKKGRESDRVDGGMRGSWRVENDSGVLELMRWAVHGVNVDSALFDESPYEGGRGVFWVWGRVFDQVERVGRVGRRAVVLDLVLEYLREARDTKGSGRGGSLRLLLSWD